MPVATRDPKALTKAGALKQGAPAEAQLREAVNALEDNTREAPETLHPLTQPRTQETPRPVIDAGITFRVRDQVEGDSEAARRRLSQGRLDGARQALTDHVESHTREVLDVAEEAQEPLMIARWSASQELEPDVREQCADRLASMTNRYAVLGQGDRSSLHRIGYESDLKDAIVLANQRENLRGLGAPMVESLKAAKDRIIPP